MNIYRGHFSYLDEEYVLRMGKETLEAMDILEAALILKNKYQACRIRSLTELQETVERIKEVLYYEEDVTAELVNVELGENYSL